MGKLLRGTTLEAVIRGFPKIRGTILGVPIIKDYSILGSVLGSPYLGNYHTSICHHQTPRPYASKNA